MLVALEKDERFKSNYPALKQVLKTLFLLRDEDDKSSAFSQLTAMEQKDWNTDGASAQFDMLNAKYGYFNNATQREVFTELAVACRSMIVLFEKNNTAEDTMAYDYAYKLMALFVDPASKDTTKEIVDYVSSQAYKLLTTNADGDKAHPFHDALLVKLSQLPRADQLTDCAGWRELVKKEGVKSFNFLAMAENIEKKISTQGEGVRRAPKTMDEANKMAALCRYEYSKYDSDFAELCYQYKVSENRFNLGLIYMLGDSTRWPKKCTDTIPDIQITGKEEASGYCWVKLPPSDKRALILGDITDCCQSIGGESEKCVKDAVSLSDNALYVLLKRRSGGPDSAPMKEGEINYKNFQIIGQSYVWKSKMGNICLDSIECLSHSISDEALQSITTDFATQLLQSNPDMTCVTAGQGGKTPSGLFDLAVVSEVMQQGYAYGDSKYQYCIANTPYALDETQCNARDALIASYPKEFKEAIVHLSLYQRKPESDRFVAELGNLLAKTPSLKTELTPYSLARLFSLSPKPTLNDFVPVDFDVLEQLKGEDRKIALESISPARLLWRETTLQGLLRGIQFLPEDQRLNHLSIMLKEGGTADWKKTSWYDFVKSGQDSTDILISIVKSLPEEDQFKLLNTEDENGNTVLRAAIKYNNVSLMSVILSLCKNDAQRVELLNAPGKYECSTLNDAANDYHLSSIDMLLNVYSEAELFSAVKQIGSHGEALLFCRQDFAVGILKRLSPEHRLEALLQESTGIGRKETAIERLTRCFQPSSRELELIHTTIELLSEAERVKVVNDYHLLRQFVEYPDLFISILNLLPENKRLEAVSKPYFDVSRFSNQLQSETLLQQAVRDKAPASVSAILDMYPKEQRLEVFLEQFITQNQWIYQLFFKPDVMMAVLNSMPEDNSRLILRNTLWDKIGTQDNLENIWRGVGKNPALLSVIPSNRLFETVTTLDERGINYVLKTAVHNDRNLFVAIWKNLPDNLQHEALNTKNKWGLSLGRVVASYPDLLALLPEPTRINLVRESIESGQRFDNLRHLTPEQSSALIRSMKDKLPNIIDFTPRQEKEEEFKSILEKMHLTRELKTDLYNAIRDKFPGILKTEYNLLGSGILDSFTAEQKAAVIGIKTLMDQLEPIAAKEDIIAFASVLMNEDQQEIKTQLDQLIKQSESPSQLISVLSSLDALWLKKIDEAVGLKLTAELESQPNNIEVMLNQYAESLLSNISKERSNEYKNIVTSRRGSAAGQDEEPTSTPAPG